MASDNHNMGPLTEEGLPRLMRGYVFKSVFGDDPEKCKHLLELIRGVPIAEVGIANGEQDLDVLPQSRAGRLDVYVRDADGNQYDVEVQASSGANEVLRARYYQALMDVTYLRKGHKVDELRKSVVIFICDFDPLGNGLRRYDCTMRCEQNGEEIGDGRSLVMLSASGGEGDVSPELDAFLHFAGGRRVDGDGFVDDIRRKIRDLVQSPRWMEAYVTFEDELKAAARPRGRAARRGSRRGQHAGKDAGRGRPGRGSGLRAARHGRRGAARDAGRCAERSVARGAGRAEATRPKKPPTTARDARAVAGKPYEGVAVVGSYPKTAWYWRHAEGHASCPAGRHR